MSMLQLSDAVSRPTMNIATFITNKEFSQQFHFPPLDQTQTSHQLTALLPSTTQTLSGVAESLAHNGELSVAAAPITRRASNQSSTAPPQRGWRRALGPLLACAAAFFISISSVASKFLLESFATSQIGVFRFASLCLITTPFML